MMAMWMPIMLFFFMGFEHSIVNMFLFPFSMIMGGGFTFAEYMLWNELPTALGNLVGGFVLVGLPLYFTHVRTSPERILRGRLAAQPMAQAGSAQQPSLKARA